MFICLEHCKLQLRMEHEHPEVSSCTVKQHMVTIGRYQSRRSLVLASYP